MDVSARRIQRITLALAVLLPASLACATSLPVTPTPTALVSPSGPVPTVAKAASTPASTASVSPSAPLPTKAHALSTPASTSPTPYPDPSPTPRHAVWREAGNLPRNFAGDLNAAGFVAADSLLLAVFRRHVWLAALGGTWSLVQLPGGGLVQADGVAYGPQMLAVGCTGCAYYVTDDEDVATGAETRGAVWASEDGADWHLIDLGAGSHLTAVATGGAGYAALGQVCAEGSVVEETGIVRCDWQTSVWRSADGVSWARSTVTLVDGDRIESALVTDSDVVILGVSELTGQRVTWRSLGTGEWQREYSALAQGAVDYAFGVAAIAMGSGVVQVGGSYSQNAEWPKPKTWRYDGSDWTASPDQAAFGAGRINDVASVGEVLVAVGTQLVHGSESPAVWSSRDGLNWSPIEPPISDPDVGAVAIEAIRDGEMLLANSNSQLWTGSLAGPR